MLSLSRLVEETEKNVDPSAKLGFAAYGTLEQVMCTTKHRQTVVYLLMKICVVFPIPTKYWFHRFTNS